MVSTCVWYSDTAHGSQASAAYASRHQPRRRAKTSIGSGAEERGADQLAQLVGEAFARPLATDLAPLDHVEVIRDLDRLVDVLIDEEDRHTARTRGPELGVDLLDDPRREAGRGLVDEEQARGGHHLLRDGQHLRLAAAQRRRASPSPLAEMRKRRVGALQ